MKKSICAIGSAVLVSGCATFGQLESGLSGLMGRNEREAFAALGYPNTKQEFGGDTVYVWGRSTGGVMFIPQTTTYTGNVGRTPVYGTATSSQMVPVNYNCTIKLVASSSGTLKSWEYDGNIGGCEGYIKRLKAYTKV
jgi:hypothetical protein